MMRTLRLVALTLAVAAGVGATASGAEAAIWTTVPSYTCGTGPNGYQPGRFYSCAKIINNIYVFTAPGKLERKRALSILRVDATYDPYYFDDPTRTLVAVQSPINGGTTGAASVLNSAQFYSSSSKQESVFFYVMGRANGAPIDYATMVALDIRQYPVSGTTCHATGILECSVEPDRGTSQYPRGTFTITSRPLDVKIVNSLVQPLVRTDGPYWSNATRAAKGDNAKTVPAASASTGPGVAYSGGLRLVSEDSGFAAIYRVGYGDDKAASPYAGALIAINIATPATGTPKGTCTPMSSPTAPFTCTVDFSGQIAGPVTATVRVRAN